MRDLSAAVQADLAEVQGYHARETHTHLETQSRRHHARDLAYEDDDLVGVNAESGGRVVPLDAWMDYDEDPDDHDLDFDTWLMEDAP